MIPLDLNFAIENMTTILSEPVIDRDQLQGATSFLCNSFAAASPQEQQQNFGAIDAITQQIRDSGLLGALPRLRLRAPGDGQMG